MDKKNIKALVLDIDGTMTDGGIYIGNDGECMKRFYVRDGLAIKHILPEHGIIPVVITGRSSAITAKRCEELDIKVLVQGCQNKISALEKILSEYGITLAETAYIGDDINDVECMRAAGLAGCPRDAVKAAKEAADFISSYDGGRGAVREFIEWIIS
ncbi:MAG: HAD-IIIA family hydrolase [Firmicutes bacterium]|nr:HAD-IIIA family hydrolase [Bacillota bacterium]